MVLGCLHLHQAVPPVLSIQMESAPDKDGTGYNAKAHAYHLGNADHVDNNSN